MEITFIDFKFIIIFMIIIALFVLSIAYELLSDRKNSKNEKQNTQKEDLPNLENDLLKTDDKLDSHQELLKAFDDFSKMMNDGLNKTKKEISELKIITDPNLNLESKKLPPLVTKLVTFCDAWIVGGYLYNNDARDIDLFIPFKHWQLASSYIPKDAKINTMGGFKCLIDNVEIDIWTGDMNDFLQSNYFRQCYSPKYGIFIKREDYKKNE